MVFLKVAHSCLPLVFLLLPGVQEEIQSQKVRIDDNQGKVDQASQELEYIKNSNANMQKRMDRIEGAKTFYSGGN